MNNTFDEVISRCVSEYRNGPSSALGKCRNRMDEERHYTLTLRAVQYFYSKACVGVNNHVNTDIAGPATRELIKIRLFILGHICTGPGVCTLWSSAKQLSSNIPFSANHDHSTHFAGLSTSLVLSSS